MTAMARNKKKHNNDTNNTMGNPEAPLQETPETDIAAPEKEQVADEQAATEQLRAELDTANDKYLRLYAEFDNYKRRIAKERIELMQTAGKEVITNLLPVLDDLDRALKAFETATEEIGRAHV